MHNLKIQILSVPHREKLIAEIQCKNYVIAEINQDHDFFEIELFSYDDHQIIIPLNEFLEAIKEAKIKLLS